VNSAHIDVTGSVDKFRRVLGRPLAGTEINDQLEDDSHADMMASLTQAAQPPVRRAQTTRLAFQPWNARLRGRSGHVCAASVTTATSPRGRSKVFAQRVTFGPP
jgi:hypothetical protein